MQHRRADPSVLTGTALVRGAGTAFWTFTLTTTGLVALIALPLAPLAFATSAAGALAAVAVFIGPAALLARALRHTTSRAMHAFCWSVFGVSVGVSTASGALRLRDPDMPHTLWWVILAAGALAGAAVVRGWRVATREPTLRDSDARPGTPAPVSAESVPVERATKPT